jgi:peptide/nickel transport system substrate-binding protein
MYIKKALFLLTFVGATLLCLTNCTPPPVNTPANSTSPPPTPTATATAVPEPTPTFTATPPPPKTLVICQQAEPDSLYLYGNSWIEARHIQEALYDGPIDNRTYSHQPVILEKLPSLADGDAILNTIIVQAGDQVVDAYGTPVELEEGMLIYPTECRSADCAVEFDGEPVEMDRLVVTFRLREGVTWSDGEPVTAYDSVYSYELREAPETPTSKYTELRTESYVAKDELTVVWTGLPGFFDPTYTLNFYPPLPRHQWQETLDYDAAEVLASEEANRNPLGWGPFMISEWIAGDHITLVKNPYYFRADEGLPYVDTVIFRFIQDANTAIAQLLSGECDIVTQDAELEDQAELLLEMQKHGVLEPAITPDTLWEHVNFGINPAPNYDRPDFFENKRMRQAIAYCLNRQEVVDTLMHGRATLLTTYVPPAHPLSASSVITTYPHDPEKGMQILEELGWTDENEDGVREARGVDGVRNGTRLSFSWLTTSQTLHKRYQEQFQQDLADCGIEVAMENLPLLEFFARSDEGPLYGRRFDLSSFAWSGGTEIPACELYMSTEIPNEENAWSGSNFSGFSNEAYDAACERALRTLPGTPEYEAAHREAQLIFSEQLPALPLFTRLKIAVTRPEVSGFALDTTEESELWNIEELDLER